MTQRSDVERLLDASIELIQKDQEIDRLLDAQERLKAENALLRARLDILALRRAKALREFADLSYPLRQAE